MTTNNTTTDDFEFIAPVSRFLSSLQKINKEFSTTTNPTTTNNKPTTTQSTTAATAPTTTFDFENMVSSFLNKTSKIYDIINDVNNINDITLLEQFIPVNPEPITTPPAKSSSDLSANLASPTEQIQHPEHADTITNDIKQMFIERYDNLLCFADKYAKAPPALTLFNKVYNQLYTDISKSFDVATDALETCKQTLYLKSINEIINEINPRIRLPAQCKSELAKYLHNTSTTLDLDEKINYTPSNFKLVKHLTIDWLEIHKAQYIII